MVNPDWNTTFDLLTNGSYLNATIKVYTDVIGGIWFWGLLLLTLMLCVYIRTQNLTYVITYTIVTVLVLGVSYIDPFLHKILMVIIVLALALELLRVYWGWGGAQ